MKYNVIYLYIHSYNAHNILLPSTRHSSRKSLQCKLHKTLRDFLDNAQIYVHYTTHIKHIFTYMQHIFNLYTIIYTIIYTYIHLYTYINIYTYILIFTYVYIQYNTYNIQYIIYNMHIYNLYTPATPTKTATLLPLPSDEEGTATIFWTTSLATSCAYMHKLSPLIPLPIWPSNTPNQVCQQTFARTL